MPFNMARYVLAAGAGTPDKIALALLGPAKAERWSYARLIASVRGAAAGLLDEGLVPGDRVMLRLGNAIAFPVAFLGAIAAGLVPVPGSAQLTAPEVTKMAAELDPALVVAEDGLALPDHPAPVLPAARLMEMTALPPADWHLGDPERPAYIVFTSGTGGQPRGVVHAHRAILARRMMWEGWYGLDPGDRVLHAGAFNWTYTLGTGLLDPWSRGATALVSAAGTEMAQLPLLLKRHEATIFAAVPGVYRRLLRLPPLDLPKLRHGLSAGEKLPEGLRAAWRDATGTDIHEAFGMSECSTFLSGAPGTPAPAGTLGFAQPGRRVAVVHDGAPAAPGTPGTLAIHRSDPGLMRGYLGHEDETAARFAGDWFLTGDMVRQRDDGAFDYLGRTDDMLNAGGLRVSPIEIEEALIAHPGIAEAAVCDLRPSPDTTILGAFVVGEGWDEDELRGFLSTRLAGYKVPRLFIARQSLPRGANGKLLRRVLRQDWNHGTA